MKDRLLFDRALYPLNALPDSRTDGDEAARAVHRLQEHRDGRDPEARRGLLRQPAVGRDGQHVVYQVAHAPQRAATELREPEGRGPARYTEALLAQNIEVAEMVAREDERLKLDPHPAREFDALPHLGQRHLARAARVAEDDVREGVASQVVPRLGGENLLDHVAAGPERLRAQVAAGGGLVPIALEPCVARARHDRVLDAPARL